MPSSIADLTGDWELVVVAGFAVTMVVFMALHCAHSAAPAQLLSLQAG